MIFFLFECLRIIFFCCSQDTTLNLQVEGKIHNPNEILIDKSQTTCMHVKSCSFRLQSSGNPEKPVQDKDG